MRGTQIQKQTAELGHEFDSHRQRIVRQVSRVCFLNSLAGLPLAYRPNGVRQSIGRPTTELKTARSPTAMTSETHNRQSSRASLLRRYLGIDVRPRSFGFVVIEDATVLDSGIRMCNRSEFDDCLGQGFDRILKTYRPSALIIRGVRGLPTGSGKRKVMATITRRAKAQGADVIAIRLRTIRIYFQRHNATTKYQIAECVATALPELAWKLPRNRKPWESEHYRMSIFDAAALVVSYLEL
jgi:hypothetical protein